MTTQPITLRCSEMDHPCIQHRTWVIKVIEHPEDLDDILLWDRLRVCHLLSPITTQDVVLRWPLFRVPFFKSFNISSSSLESLSMDKCRIKFNLVATHELTRRHNHLSWLFTKNCDELNA
jgi:hypothetical protein